MPKKLEIPPEKVTLNLFEGDKQILQDRYGKLGWSPVVRQLVRNHCRKLLEKEARTESLNDRSEIDAIAGEIDIDITDSRPSGSAGRDKANLD